MRHAPVRGLLCGAIAWVAVGCGATDPVPLGDAGATRDGGGATARDAGGVRDAGRLDAGESDAGSSDAGTPDAGPRDGGIPPGLYFPPDTTDEWERIDPSAVGWDPVQLEAALDYAASANSTAVIVLHRGRILAERYANRWDLHTSQPIFSATKSVVAFLIGLLVQDGALDLDDNVTSHLGAGWSQASASEEAAITVRHLLTMTSGLDDQLGFVTAPGATWYYNTPAYYVLFAVIEAASGVTRDAFSAARLEGPIALRDTRWTPTRMAMSARDMARFGLLILAGGAWDGTALVTEPAILTEAITSSQDLNPAYGHLWWLNGQDAYLLPGNPARGGPGPLMPDAPADLFAALGAGDKKIYVVPSLELVVVRHGGPAGEPTMASSSFDNQLWRALMAAAP